MSNGKKREWGFALGPQEAATEKQHKVNEKPRKPLKGAGNGSGNARESKGLAVGNRERLRVSGLGIRGTGMVPVGDRGLFQKNASLPLLGMKRKLGSREHIGVTALPWPTW